MTKRAWLLDLFFLIITSGLFFACYLGSHPLLVPDEARYSEVAREMLVFSDYITPHLNGTVLLDKPVLYYWLQVSAIKTLGLNEWALRVWPALLGVLGCVLTYIAGRILFDRRSGILAAIILATSPLYFGLAHYANLDIEVAVFITGALLSFIVAQQYPTGKIRNSGLLAMYVFAALAVLTKGLIGVVFPILVVGVWIIILNRWQVLKTVHLFKGLLLLLVIVMPWYVWVQNANPDFFNYFFVNQQFTRFVSKDFNNPQPFWFYGPVLLLGFLPWTVYLAQMLTTKIQRVWRDRQRYSTELFLLLWPLIILLFFSLPNSKTIGYLIPAIPPLALLLGNYCSKVWVELPSRAIRCGVVIFILLALLTAAYIVVLPHIASTDVIPSELVSYLYGIAVVLFLSALGALFLLQRQPFSKIFSLQAATMALLLLLMMAATPHANLPSIKPLVMQLKTSLQSSDEVVSYYRYYYDLPFYLQRQVAVVASWQDPNIINGDNWEHELWQGSKEKSATVILLNEQSFLQQWQSNRRVVVVTNQQNYPRLQRLVNNKLYIWIRYQNELVVSNKPSLLNVKTLL